MNTRRRAVSIAGSLFLLFPQLTWAEPGTVTGGVIVPVIDPNGSSCIDVTKQSVSMFVLGLKAQRYSSWFSDSKQVGLKIDVQITGPTGTSADFSFPRALALTPVGAGDILSLPIATYPILTSYSFKDKDGKPFSRVGTGFSFINITGSNAFAKSITTLINFTKTLPIPANPYEQGVQYFGNFVNTLVDAETDPANGQTVAAVNKDLYVGNGACKSSQLHEGTYAIVYDFDGSGGLFSHHGNPPPGTISTSTIAIDGGATAAGTKQYCFYLSGSAVTYAERGAASSCTGATTPRQVLNNPQMVIETVAYDLPQKAPTGQMAANLAMFKSNTFFLGKGNSLSKLTTTDLSNFPAAAKSQTLMKIQGNLSQGATIEEALKKIQGVKVAPDAKFAEAKDTTTLALALANLRAAARCKNVGIPTKLCVVESLHAP